MAKKGKYTYDWPRPTVSVDAVVFTLSGSKAKVLLINRRYEPFKGQWALPGGFVDIDEELEDAVVRELAEETGLADVHLEQMRAFGKCGRDPRSRQITIAFMGIATEGKLPKDMGFDHNEIVKFAIEKIKGMI
ncbi:MAG: NUDIX domain-containing protein [Planctomycetota bacterium]|jgi:8-oxo-dGTP diphosphatase